MNDQSLGQLLSRIDRLTADIEAESAEILEHWHGWIGGTAFQDSATNLAQYLALRHRDLRDLQHDLMLSGLSSLGRSESRVAPSLAALRRTLALACGEQLNGSNAPVTASAFFAGQQTISARADAILGAASQQSAVRLMVTLPGDASSDSGFFVRLAELGVEAVRINCAHDDEAAWTSMILNVERAAARTGRRMKVMMDLPGPKIRTGSTREGRGKSRLQVGDELAIARPGRLGDAPGKVAAVECTLDRAVLSASPGQPVYIDDGKLASTIVTKHDWGLLVRIEAGPDEKGYKLKPEKGINFPDADLDVSALTDDDRVILGFAAKHADGIEYSFVQTVEDVEILQQALAEERPDDWQRLSLVLKVETRRAVRNLPDMIVRAAGRQPTAVMIARGDLAVEIGFGRVAEMQEEILWLCEAAHVPVIWATQVMEGLLKTGTPSRGEMTDAAMAARAECVMLNKGPHLFEGILTLRRLLDRMAGHMNKKAYLMRSLQSW